LPQPAPDAGAQAPREKPCMGSRGLFPFDRRNFGHHNDVEFAAMQWHARYPAAQVHATLHVLPQQPGETCELMSAPRHMTEALQRVPRPLPGSIPGRRVIGSALGETALLFHPVAIPAILFK
jgi:hypothetical protein